MKIESIRLKNFKVFRDINLRDIPAFMVVVGANGSGKTTLFDVFGFLHDCLKGTVREALDKRGHFREVLSRDANPATDRILIEIQYRMLIADVERLVTYSLEIGEHNNAPTVFRELLRYKRGRGGSPFHFLDFKEGEGYAIINEEDFNKTDEELERETQKVKPDSLAIKGLGQFERFKAANTFRQLIESWHVSDFHISAARGRKEVAGNSEHLSETGDNLPRVVQYLYEHHPKAFQKILRTHPLLCVEVTWSRLSDKARTTPQNQQRKHDASSAMRIRRITQTRFLNSLLCGSISMRSPISTKAGTGISKPVPCRRAGFITLPVVSPRTAGSVYSTSRTMVDGSSTDMALPL